MKQDAMPSLDSIAKGRSDKETYLKFCNLVLLNVVGKSTWNLGLLTVKLTKLATRSDEAFGMLVLLNNWDRAKYIAEQELAGTEKSQIKDGRPKTRYTLEGGYALADGGWCNAGLVEMTRLSEQVGMDRLAHGKAFNHYFTTEQKKGAGGTLKRKAKTPVSQETEAEKKARSVPNDFDSESDDDDLDDDNATE